MKYEKKIKNKCLRGVIRLGCISYFILHTSYLVADDCLSYKTNPAVKVNIPSWNKEVVQPLKPMDLWHGNVIATLDEDFEITVDTTPIEDGFCVALKSVSASIGYGDFQVSIDSRHIPDSCAYNAVLTHEDEHIRAYLSVIDDSGKDIRTAVATAANSVMPVFVRDAGDIDGALDALHEKLLSHPEIILMKQKIEAQQEIRNNDVDRRETGAALKKCLE